MKHVLTNITSIFRLYSRRNRDAVRRERIASAKQEMTRRMLERLERNSR